MSKDAHIAEKEPALRQTAALRQDSSSSFFEEELRKFDPGFRVEAVRAGRETPYLPVSKNGKAWFERDLRGGPEAALHLDRDGAETTVGGLLKDWTEFAAGEDLAVRAVADGEVLTFTMADEKEPGVARLYFAPGLDESRRIVGWAHMLDECMGR